jgi:opacity protein-like surface antigen
MSKLKSAAAILAMVAAAVAAPSAAMAASAKPAESVYTSSSMTRCFERNDLSNPDCVHFQAYSTYSATQIWINGHVSCSWSGTDSTVDITWCGVGGGNGTAYLNIGLNWNVPDWDASGLYERMNIVSGGEGCATFGTNSKVGQITTWYNKSLVCEAPA